MQSSSLHWGLRLSFHEAKDGERKTDDASLQPKFFPSERTFCIRVIVLSRKSCQLCQLLQQTKPSLFSFSFQLSIVSWDPFQGSKPLTTPNTVCWTWAMTDQEVSSMWLSFIESWWNLDIQNDFVIIPIITQSPSQCRAKLTQVYDSFMLRRPPCFSHQRLR